MGTMMDLINNVKFDDKGLVTVVTQDFATSEVLMVAYMNRDTLLETINKGVMIYFSRSRQKRWFKGETSGHVQNVKEMYIDCDGDCLLFKVEQTGAACHENYFSCFFRQNINAEWKTVKTRIEE
jgi:phosphoribosyl-AMP cyclohydrolase